MRDRGGKSVSPSRGTLRDVYHLPAYGYKKNSAPGVLADAQRVLTVLGLAGLAHPIRRLQNPGGVMAFPGGRPKFPGFMTDPVEVHQFPKDLVAPRIGRIDPFDSRLGGLWANLMRNNPETSPEFGLPMEKRIGHLPEWTPLAPGHYMARNESFMSHLERLHNQEANRAFVNWMMEHHYRRPN